MSDCECVYCTKGAYHVIRYSRIVIQGYKSEDAKDKKVVDDTERCAL